MEFDVTVPVDTGDKELALLVSRRTGTSGPYRILRKSLDARKKPHLFWNYRISTGKGELRRDSESIFPVLFRRNAGRALVVGSGPAGFFAADIMSRAGYDVILLEKGPPADERRQDIENYEAGGPLKSSSNYACGEGGAGTFSDGKLTSRSKSIALEKEYILSRYVTLGAPEEILWLTHPHIGSDKLFTVVQQGRKELQARGVDFRFNTEVTGLLRNPDGSCGGVTAGDEQIPADITILAPGHSSFQLFRMLLAQGAVFEPKGFAVGFRIEHPRELINLSQWGRPEIPGIKAAEYRLTTKADSGRGVYSFCMCPGGRVVPASWRSGINIVNGVSMFSRNSAWSNAAVVASVHPEELFPGVSSPEEILDALELLEARPWKITGEHAAPAAHTGSLLKGDRHGKFPESSYPFSLIPVDYRMLYPEWLLSDLKYGIDAFSRKIRGYEKGLIIGMETTTSAALKIRRKITGEVENIPGLFIVGEGSGSAGGIMSSAVDGLNTASAIVQSR